MQHSFFPGSPWLYIKVFCGYKSAEKILALHVHEFVIENSDLFEKVFFIRYSEDFPHFRIRFFNRDAKKNLELQHRFISHLQEYIDNEVIHKVTIDTYQREMKRYGSHLIEETETLFYFDSLACLKMIHLFSEIEESQKYRVLISLRGIDELLNSFELTLDQKYRFSKMIQTGFFREFGAHPNLQKQLNDKYRSFQKLIFSHMDSSKDNENEIEEAIAILNERSKGITNAVSTIFKNVENENRLFDLLASYVHMHMNRMFLSQQRKYELVLYHFLEKYYASQLAIQKKK